jgi:hypothetical protein
MSFHVERGGVDTLYERHALHALHARCEPLPVNVSANLQERIIDFLDWHEVAALRQLAQEFYEFAETLNAVAKSVHLPSQLYSRATTVPFYHLKNGYRVVTYSVDRVLPKGDRQGNADDPFTKRYPDPFTKRYP